MIHYSELKLLNRAELKERSKSFTQEDWADLKDQRTFTVPELAKEANYVYFDTSDELKAYLLSNYVPSTKPWLAEEITEHESLHAKCALAMGVTGIRFSVNLNGRGVHTQIYSPVELPALAYGAIAMHPSDSERSEVDRGVLSFLGYVSRQHVVDRVQRWNEQDNGLYIPEPERN